MLTTDLCEINWSNSRSNKRCFEVGDNLYSRRKRKFSVGDNLDQDKLGTKKQKTRKDSEKQTGTQTTQENSLLTVTPLDKKETEPILALVSGGTQIYSRDNHVYFNTNIDLSSMTLLQKEVQAVIDKIVEKAKLVEDLGFVIKHPPVVLHINSSGGGIFAAFTFIDFMAHIKRKLPLIKFHSVVEGRAASAATLISVTADERFITEYGYMLIHQLWSFTMGKYNEIKDDVTNLDNLMIRIKEIYKKHTKVPEKEIDEILKHDIYWDAKTCKEYKLVDAIL